jgi:Tol biopolymer transport system component
MTPERWRQVTNLFHRALDRDVDARAAFVATECGDDLELRREVDAMLAGHQEPGLLSDVASPSRDPVFTPGTRLGTYEIESMLGSGGMGEVYRARDITLHREVALKVLLRDVATDPDRMARFASEARLLAALNHPHIAHVYGFEMFPSRAAGEPGLHALIMELVEGRTLAQRLSSGPMPITESLATARQIAEALDAAHERGIVHRDLKPSNITVRADGTVKVLDFGLAKTAAHVTPATDVAPLTAAGMIVGTAAYMAPEQAKGQPVDRRADLWAFGCVLFEMLTGAPAFDDDSLAGVLAKVLGADPAWHTLPRAVPGSIRTLLSRCLQRDPKHRLDSAAVARIEIEDALAGAVSVSGRLTRVPGFALGGMIGVAAIAALWIGSRRSDSSAISVPRLQNAMQVTNALGVENSPTWSPDGTRVAYHASDGGYGFERSHDIWVSQIGRGDPINLTGGVGDNLVPSWSPDGRDIAFFSNRAGAWAVYTMPAIGGRPRQVLPLSEIYTYAYNTSAPQWSSDGSRLHVSVRQGAKNVVLVLTLSSLQTTRVELPDHEGTVVWDLNLSPDGRRYAYVSARGGQPEVSRLWTIGSDGGNPVSLTDGRTNVWSPTWSRTGREVYYISNRGGAMDLWQQTVRADGTPAGEPVPVTAGLGIRSAAFSADGRRIAYSRGNWISNVWKVPILADRPATWNDATAMTSERAFVEFVDVSPDGRQLALSSDRRGNQDLWVMPAEGGEMTPLTTDPAPDWNPRWSPDGREIVFYSARSGNRDIWVMPSAGGPARQLTANSRSESEPSWSPDGREILFSSGERAAWIVSAAGGEPRLLAEGFTADPVWSPDGSWILLRKHGLLYRAPRDGGTPTPLPFAPPHAQSLTPRFSSDGQSLYYAVVSGPKADQNLWKLSLVDGKASPLTRLEGRRGSLTYYFARDARSLYFTWNEDDGDIWVMDVVPGSARTDTH